jgi:hypothetical protein
VLLQDYYELGVILTRKRLFTQATKNLEKAKKLWDGEESDLAQVRHCWEFISQQQHAGAPDRKQGRLLCMSSAVPLGWVHVLIIIINPYKPYLSASATAPHPLGRRKAD